MDPLSPHRLAGTLAEANVAPIAETPPAVEVPIDASGSATALFVRQSLFQIIGALGVFVAVMGFGDTSTIAHVYRFLSSDVFIPIVGLLATGIMWGWQQLRALRRKRQIEVLSLIPSTPDSVAIGPANPSAAVVKAVEAATVKIDQAGTGPSSSVANTGSGTNL